MSVIEAYANNIRKGYMTIEEVPDRYREEVIKAMEDEHD